MFHGLDWVATVPPTIALCRAHFGEDGTVVFGWVLASHQVGAALIAWGAGFVRDATGNYDPAWFTAGAAVVDLPSLQVRLQQHPEGCPCPAPLRFAFERTRSHSVPP